jgi:2-polyprenyl-6-hydroxyphenyl methylase/3-demethylubiquinone-9 3-methyltransferase
MAEKDIKKVEKYFSKNALTWHDLYIKPKTSNDIVLQDRMNIAIHLVEKYATKKGNVFDLGCGAGLVGIKLAEKGYRVHSLDISSEMIDICKKNYSKANTEYKNHKFSVGEFSNFKIKNETYDVIVALGFLEYQENEYDILKQMNSILKPGGILIISGPQRLSICRLLTQIFFKIIKQPLELSRNFYSPSRFKKLLGSSQFQINDIIQHGFAGFPLLEYFTGLTGGKLVNNFFTSLSKIIPIKAFCNDIVIAAIKEK